MSFSEQAIDQNPEYKPFSIYDSMENDQKNTRVIFFLSLLLSAIELIGMKYEL